MSSHCHIFISTQTVGSIKTISKCRKCFFLFSKPSFHQLPSNKRKSIGKARENHLVNTATGSAAEKLRENHKIFFSPLRVGRRREPNTEPIHIYFVGAPC